MTEIAGGELYCAAGSGGLSLRVPVGVTVESSAVHPLRAVCGGEIAPLQQSPGERPSLLLRRTEAETELWDIAKDCRTSVRSIREANDLPGDTVSEHTLLLIPM